MAGTDGHWVGSWAASMQIPEPDNALPPGALLDATLRQIVHLSLGGELVRVRLSNLFGTTPLRIAAAHLAHAVRPGISAIDPKSDTALTFDGRRDVVIAAGSERVCDPLRFAAPEGGDLAITLHLPGEPEIQTGHPGSRTTSFLVHGDGVSAPALAGATTVDHWYFICGLDVVAPPNTGAITIIGDSIADGRGSIHNANNRWSDHLAARLRTAKLPLGVLNLGMGGNRLLTFGLGPSGLARFERDILGQSGVRYLIVHHAINDIGMFDPTADETQSTHDAFAARLIAGYRHIIDGARARAIAAIGATLMPFFGSQYHAPEHLNPRAEADRQAVNAWIRTPGHFDGIIDFDRALRDPDHPERLSAPYDCGDHLHPSPAGLRAMAEAIRLALFAPTS